MIAASAAPFYLPSACFPERSPPSCGGDPLQRHKAPDVVGQVLQANFGARSHDADRAYDPAAQRGLLSCEHVLDAGANFASVAVRIRLRTATEAKFAPASSTCSQLNRPRWAAGSYARSASCERAPKLACRTWPTTSGAL